MNLDQDQKPPWRSPISQVERKYRYGRSFTIHRRDVLLTSVDDFSRTPPVGLQTVTKRTLHLLDPVKVDVGCLKSDVNSLY